MGRKEKTGPDWTVRWVGGVFGVRPNSPLSPQNKSSPTEEVLNTLPGLPPAWSKHNQQKASTSHSTNPSCLLRNHQGETFS